MKSIRPYVEQEQQAVHEIQQKDHQLAGKEGKKQAFGFYHPNREYVIRRHDDEKAAKRWARTYGYQFDGEIPEKWVTSLQA